MRHRLALAALSASVAALACASPLFAQDYFFRWRAEGVTSSSNPYAPPQTTSEPAQALAVSTVVAPPAEATVGTAVSADWDASGGTAPYAWALVGAPTGMTVDAAGVMTWTPSAAGTYTGIQASVSDAAGASASAAAFDVVVREVLLRETRMSASDGWAYDEFGYSVAVSGDYAVVGAYMDDNERGTNAGAAYVLQRGTDGVWQEVRKLVAGDGAADDRFGTSVAISGGRVVVGAMYDANEKGTNAGSAYVWEGSGTSWTMVKKLVSPDGAASDYAGSAVAIDGERVVVGSHGDDNERGGDAGSAYVWEGSGTNWTMVKKLVAGDGVAGDYIGWSVALSGGRAVIGGPYDDDERGTDVGSAYVWEGSGTNWVMAKKLVAGDGGAGDRFGFSVAVSGGRVVAGAYLDADNGMESGSAYVWEGSGTNWSMVKKLVPSDIAPGDQFGRSVAISGGRVVVGAVGDDDKGSNSGSAYVWDGAGATWTMVKKLVASDGAASDYFGWSVATDGGRSIVGAYADDNESGTNAGTVYLLD